MPKKKNRRGTCLPAPPPRNPSPNLTQVAISSRSAPLPHPSELEEYDRILPGAAERILAMAESQSTHRQGMEKKALFTESINSRLGIISALVIGVAGLSIAGFCIYTGHDTAGATLGGTTLGSLVWTFVYGTRQRRIEREQKYLATTRSSR
jgi:uncharacterized membrane protein